MTVKVNGAGSVVGLRPALHHPEIRARVSAREQGNRMQLNGNSETTASNGKLFTAFGVIVGMTLAARAWTAWRAGSHAVEHSVAVGILAAGMVIAGLDATWRMRAQDARVAADWTEVAFDAAVGGRIDGWPAWLVGAILSAIATMLIPTL